MLIICPLPSDYGSLVGIKVTAASSNNLFAGMPIIDTSGNIGVFVSQYKQLTDNIYGYGALNVNSLVDLHVTYLPK